MFKMLMFGHTEKCETKYDGGGTLTEKVPKYPRPVGTQNCLSRPQILMQIGIAFGKGADMEGFSSTRKITQVDLTKKAVSWLANITYCATMFYLKSYR